MRHTRLSTPVLGALATLAAGSLVALSAAPGAAAVPVAQATASAISLTIGGQPVNAGSYRVVNDGSSETRTGTNQPAITALGGQQLITAGVLAQDAATSVSGPASDRSGSSRACAGLAGQGGSVVGVGNGTTCLVPGQAVTLGAGTLDLSNLQLVSSGLFQGVDQQLQQQLQAALAPLTQALQTGLTQAVTQLGLGLNVELGAVQAACTAEPGTASGTARLVGSKAYVQVGGQRVDLVDLPADPAPNTKLVTGLGDVAALVENAVRTQLTTLLGNLSAIPGLPAGLPIGQLPGADQTAILNNALSQLGQQLKPLQDNLIDVTLNKQTKASADQIEVTALDLTLLPVAQQQFGVTPFNLQIGTVTCGPSGKLAAPEPTPTPTATPTPKGPPAPVPTKVPAGLETTASPAAAPGGRDWGGLLALSGLVLVAAGAAGAGVHRAAQAARADVRVDPREK